MMICAEITTRLMTSSVKSCCFARPIVARPGDHCSNHPPSLPLQPPSSPNSLQAYWVADAEKEHGEESVLRKEGVLLWQQSMSARKIIDSNDRAWWKTNKGRLTRSLSKACFILEEIIGLLLCLCTGNKRKRLSFFVSFFPPLLFHQFWSDETPLQKQTSPFNRF